MKERAIKFKFECQTLRFVAQNVRSTFFFCTTFLYLLNVFPEENDVNLQLSIEIICTKYNNIKLRWRAIVNWAKSGVGSKRRKGTKMVPDHPSSTFGHLLQSWRHIIWSRKNFLTRGTKIIIFLIWLFSKNTLMRNYTLFLIVRKVPLIKKSFLMKTVILLIPSILS